MWLFTLYGLVYLVGVGLWLLIDANKPVAAEDDHTGTAAG